MGAMGCGFWRLKASIRRRGPNAPRRFLFAPDKLVPKMAQAVPTQNGAAAHRYLVLGQRFMLGDSQGQPAILACRILELQRMT